MAPLDREKGENIMTTSRTITDAEWEQLTGKARELGYAHGYEDDGKAFPIRDEQHARRLLIAITSDELHGQGLTQDQFDTVIGDLPSAPLSGEFSGDPTPHTLYEQLGVTADDDTDDGELCQAYEDGYSEGVSSMVAQRCRAMLSLPERRFEIVTDAIPENRGIMVRFDEHTDVSVCVREDGSLVVRIDTLGDGPANERGPIGLVVTLNEDDLYDNPVEQHTSA